MQTLPPRRSARLAAKRRGKPNTEFIRHKPTVLDKLPMEIIKYQIFSHLDYDSRINLNQCLPIWDRVSNKMTTQSLMKHDMQVRVKILSHIIVRVAEEAWDNITYSFRTVLRGDTRMLEMIKLFKILQEPPYFKIIGLYPSFHKAVVEKIAEFEAVSIEDKKSYSQGTINKFNLEIIKLKTKIEKEKHFFTITASSLDLIKSVSFV